jgi:predicted flap endonuclease-1-like 5' DNA nuclease
VSAAAVGVIANLAWSGFTVHLLFAPEPEALAAEIVETVEAAVEAVVEPAKIVAEAAVETVVETVEAANDSVVEAVEATAETLEPVALAPVEAEAVVEALVPEAPVIETPVVEAPAVEAAVAETVETAEAIADDLTRLVGIGPKLAVSLADLGVTSFSQIAAWTSEDLASIDQLLNLKGRADRDAWIAQAKLFDLDQLGLDHGRFHGHQLVAHVLDLEVAIRLAGRLKGVGELA